MIDFDALLQDATAVIAAWTPKVLAALAVLVVGMLIARWSRGMTRRAIARSKVDPMLAPFIAGLVHVGIVVLVAITAVNTIGVATTSFVAVIGAAGLAIALAFQGTFSNFASGVILLTFRPFDIGNFVEVGGQSGTVRSAGIFSSGVAVRTCWDVLAADARVMEDPEAVVAVNELGDSSVNLVVRPWVKASDYWVTRWDLTRALKENLEAAGCSIPFPQRDVHIHQAS